MTKEQLKDILLICDRQLVVKISAHLLESVVMQADRCLVAEELLRECRADLEAAQTKVRELEQRGDLDKAKSEFVAALPGWSYLVSDCLDTKEAHCWPDISGQDSDLLACRTFEAGFRFISLDGEGATVADLLRKVTAEAVCARIEARSAKWPCISNADGWKTCECEAAKTDQDREAQAIAWAVKELKPDHAAELADAIREFERALPGWWYTVGTCSVSRDASCGPERTGPDAGLLVSRVFDDGFHHDDRDPGSTMAGSLRLIMHAALKARAAGVQPEDTAGDTAGSLTAGSLIAGAFDKLTALANRLGIECVEAILEDIGGAKVAVVPVDPTDHMARLLSLRTGSVSAALEMWRMLVSAGRVDRPAKKGVDNDRAVG